MNDSTKKRLILGAIILVIVIILIAVIISTVKNKDNVTNNINKNESGYENDVKPEESQLPSPDTNYVVRVTND